MARRIRFRSGYTLLELLLVLAILCAVAGAVAPAVVERMEEYRLKQATETVRIALARTRVHAIDMNSTYQFRFEPGGRRFLAVPTDGDVLATASQIAGSRSSGGGGGNALPGSVVEAGQLPEELFFQPVSTPAAAPSPVGAAPVETATADLGWSAAVARVDNALDYTSAPWSQPILYRSDGTAIDAAFSVVNRRGEGFEVSVRELTGEVTVRPVQTGVY